MGVADRGANVLVAEELLDFPQIFPQVVKQDRGRAVAQPVGCELPYPERPASGSQPQVERAIGKRLARIPCKHKLRRREGDSAGSHDPAAFKFLLEGLPLEERCTQASGSGHILEDASLALDPESDDFLPHPLAIAPSELDQLLEPAGGLEESVGQMEREGGAVAILPGFQISEEPTDIGKEEVANLRLLMERGLDFRERILEVPMLVGKGKRGTDLLEACGVLPLAQEPIGIQGGRERKTPWIEACSRRPCEKRPPGPLVGRQTICGQVPTPRSFEEIGE